MRVFGLTGGLASGKGVVAARFRERGIDVIDADQLAREAVAPGSEALAKIADRFGVEVLAEDASLDRARLAELAFASPATLGELNAIVHPRVAALLADRLAELTARGLKWACYEVPLLFENHLEGRFRPVVLVAASREHQVERAMRRSRWTRAQAEARLDAQWPLERKRALADYVIDNDNRVEDTRAQADRVLDAILAS